MIIQSDSDFVINGCRPRRALLDCLNVLVSTLVVVILPWCGLLRPTSDKIVDIAKKFSTAPACFTPTLSKWDGLPWEPSYFSSQFHFRSSIFSTPRLILFWGTSHVYWKKDVKITTILCQRREIFLVDNKQAVY